MSDIQNILLGIQIGVQLIAAFFAFRIALLEITPNVYYFVATNLLLMTLVRIDVIFNLISSTIFRYGLWTVVSVTWMFCFIKIYYLIKNK